jgi:hypothetical protein
MQQFAGYATQLKYQTSFLKTETYLGMKSHLPTDGN